jgi:hypothetical protein
MSDPASSGEPSGASAATAGPALTAATPGNSAPIGSFGTAKGSGLLRGKRPTAPAASAAAPAAPSGYQPSALEVIRPQSEYKNPFTGETSVPAPVINEPAPQAAPAPSPAIAAAPAPVAAVVKATPPAPAATAEGELFPFPLGDSAPKPAPAAPAAKAELNILPTEEVRRPAVSWGESSHAQNGEPRGRRDERPTFRPERRDGRPAEPRSFEPREPRRDPAAAERNSSPRDFGRDERPAPAAPQKKSGGFFAWLKGLFGGQSAQPEVKTGYREEQGRDGEHRGQRRRHRGGRGRGGYQGDNRGPRDGQPYQPRDPRDEEGPSQDRSQNGGQDGGQRFEGGGRRRHRGGRGRGRDDRGGPRPEGQQGGGAI